MDVAAVLEQMWGELGAILAHLPDTGKKRTQAIARIIDDAAKAGLEKVELEGPQGRFVVNANYPFLRSILIKGQCAGVYFPCGHPVDIDRLSAGDLSPRAVFDRARRASASMEGLDTFRTYRRTVASPWDRAFRVGAPHGDGEEITVVPRKAFLGSCDYDDAYASGAAAAKFFLARIPARLALAAGFQPVLTWCGSGTGVFLQAFAGEIGKAFPGIKVWGCRYDLRFNWPRGEMRPGELGVYVNGSDPAERRRLAGLKKGTDFWDYCVT